MTSLNLQRFRDAQLQPGSKGLALTQALSQAEVAAQNWSVLNADTSFPVAVLKQSALQHNLHWMQEFCRERQIVLAPHGKTTMSPQLFSAQLEHGAWGITLATVNQMQTAQRLGIKRVLLANQIINPVEIRAALHLQESDADFEFFSLCDSLAVARELSAQSLACKAKRPLQVVVELGFRGGRTGCRSLAAALDLARSIASLPGLQLVGIEAYEGLMVSAQRQQDLNAVREFMTQMSQLVQQCDAERLFQSETILLSAGGSAYFDLVADEFQSQIAQGLYSRPLLPVLRSGCYVTHDHGFYHGLIAELQARAGATVEAGLRPALEVWSMVQARPEPDLAILTMGKRDASYDIELPLPVQYHKRGGTAAPLNLPVGCKIEKMNDQHAYLRLPADSEISRSLAVGDLIACGISHPCTTFDKWPTLLVVDDSYRIVDVYNTCF